MKLENEVCRKVYDHHEVLKGELGTALLDALTRANVGKDIIASAITITNSVVDTSSSKMTSDYQRFFNSK